MDAENMTKLVFIIMLVGPPCVCSRFSWLATAVAVVVGAFVVVLFLLLVVVVDVMFVIGIVGVVASSSSSSSSPGVCFLVGDAVAVVAFLFAQLLLEICKCVACWRWSWSLSSS